MLSDGRPNVSASETSPMSMSSASVSDDMPSALGPANQPARHRRLARRPVLNDPIKLIGPVSLVGNSRETLHKSGTDGSNTVPSSGESTLELQTDSLICSCDRI